MKKIFAALITAMLALVFLASCGGVSMKELLEPESGSYTASFSVKTDDEPVFVSVIKDGDTFTFVLDEKYTFVYNGGKWSVSYSGLTVPMSGNSLKRSIPQKLCAALTAPADAGWKISEETAGGVALYKCECESLGVTLYIDVSTKLPLKLISGGAECDLIKFDPAQS